MLEIISQRGINLELTNDGQKLELNELEPHLPQIAQNKVHLDENERLVWPVMILYPETMQSDFIQNFHEDTLYVSHLFFFLFFRFFTNIIFNKYLNQIHTFIIHRLIDQLRELFREPPEWDEERRYSILNTNVYFENIAKGSVHKVDIALTLSEILRDKQ